MTDAELSYFSKCFAVLAKNQQTILNSLAQGFSQMNTQISALVADVAAQKTVNSSAVTLLAGLKAKVDQLATSPTLGADDAAALTQLSADIEGNTKQLADAVTANTPAAPVAAPAAASAPNPSAAG